MRLRLHILRRSPPPLRLNVGRPGGCGEDDHLLGERVCVYRHALEFDLTQRPVLVIGGNTLDRVERLKAIDHLSKDGVIIVQVRMLGVGDEELRRVRVGPRVGHRKDPPPRVLILRVYLVAKLTPPDRVAALASARRVSTLQHEALDVAVEERAIVVIGGAECEEVECGARHRVAEDLHLDVPMIRVERHRHGAAQVASRAGWGRLLCATKMT